MTWHVDEKGRYHILRWHSVMKEIMDSGEMKQFIEMFRYIRERSNARRVSVEFIDRMDQIQISLHWDDGESNYRFDAWSIESRTPMDMGQRVIELLDMGVK